RVLEDGIPQRIFAFAESTNPPLLVNDDGTTRSLADTRAAAEARVPGLDLDADQSFRDDPENSYTLAYYPDPSNHNEGFRKINIEIVPDVDRKWRVRSRAGYRPLRLPGK